MGDCEHKGFIRWMKWGRKRAESERIGILTCHRCNKMFKLLFHQLKDLGVEDGNHKTNTRDKR